MTKKKDLYKALGVDKNASDEEIKKAWKKSAVENHPDKGGDVDKMTEIVHAYSILSDKAKKDKYDKTGDDTNVTFYMRFQEFIQMFFIKIIDQTDNIEGVDLMKKIKEVAEANLSGTKQHKFELITRKGKIEKVVSRLESKGDNRITHILSLNI